MKKFIIIIMLLSAIISCKKSNSDSAIEQAIKGKWELRSSFCGSAVTYPAGNGTTITFYNAGQFTATGTMADSGMYRITENTNSLGQPAHVLFLDGSRDLEFRMTISNDTLKLDLIAVTPDGCFSNFKKL